MSKGDKKVENLLTQIINFLKFVLGNMQYYHNK